MTTGKNESIVKFKEFYNKIKTCITNLEKKKIKQIRSKEILIEIEEISEDWFNRIKPEIIALDYIENIIEEKYSGLFSSLLELADKNPLKITVLSIVKQVRENFNKDIIISLQKIEKILDKNEVFENLIKELSGSELEFMNESISCAKNKMFRASVILGWCATIYRIQTIIEKKGFDKFNNASKTMKTIKTGRYKRFEKCFDIQNISDLRMTVFDNDLLWIIEYLGLIDGNEHEKLHICFTIRNTSAHPGESITTPENLNSFFSDIYHIIFKNEKFKI